MAEEEEVKTLSASKKRKSLGEATKNEKAKKQRTRTTVLNPREIEWPEINAEEKSELVSLLKVLTKPLRIPCRKVPLEEIRKVPKSGRQAFRREWIRNEAAKLNFQLDRVALLRSSLTIGVNCVSKALEVGQLSAVLIEQNVNPPIITKLLVPLANSNNIPILAFEGLNSIFKETTDVRCIALGLKKSCDQVSNHFHSLLELIKSIVSMKNERTGDAEEGVQFKPFSIREIVSLEST